MVRTGSERGRAALAERGPKEPGGKKNEKMEIGFPGRGE